jgi:hypothetical protein
MEQNLRKMLPHKGNTGMITVGDYWNNNKAALDISQF